MPHRGIYINTCKYIYLCCPAGSQPSTAHQLVFASTHQSRGHHRLQQTNNNRKRHLNELHEFCTDALDVFWTVGGNARHCRQSVCDFVGGSDSLNATLKCLISQSDAFLRGRSGCHTLVCTLAWVYLSQPVAVRSLYYTYYKLYLYGVQRPPTLLDVERLDTNTGSRQADYFSLFGAGEQAASQASDATHGQPHTRVLVHVPGGPAPNKDTGSSEGECQEMPCEQAWLMLTMLAGTTPQRPANRVICCFTFPDDSGHWLWEDQMPAVG